MPIDKNGIIKPLTEPVQCDSMTLEFSEQLPDDAIIVLSKGDEKIAFIGGPKEKLLIGLVHVRKALQDSLTYNN